MSYGQGRNTESSGDPNRFSDPSDPGMGFGSQGGSDNSGFQNQPSSGGFQDQPQGGYGGQRAEGQGYGTGQGGTRPTHDPTDTSTFARDTGGRRQRQGEFEGEEYDPSGTTGTGAGAGGYGAQRRGGAGSDTLGGQYQTSAGQGESYGSTGYPSNTTSSETYGAGGDQYPRSGTGATSGEGYGGGKYGDDDDFNRQQQSGQGGEKPSMGQKIKDTFKKL